MSLAQSTNDCHNYSTLEALSSTIGTSIIALALLTSPASAAETSQRLLHSPITIPHEMPNTEQSSAIMTGLLHENVSTLISTAAKAAIGSTGLSRLEAFFQLQPGWDGKASKPIDLNSVADFSKFFDETNLCPSGLGVFMSAQGNMVINWPDQQGQLIELEFHSSGVDYFVERNEEEGTFPGKTGFNALLKKIEERVEV